MTHIVHTTNKYSHSHCSAFIALSNRDEYFNRPTQRAHFWDAPYSHILAPHDLARSERGTWIGITKQGRLAILLNFHELESAENENSLFQGTVSRGLFPREFLEAPTSETTQQFIERVHSTYGEKKLRETGGFTMVCGVLRQAFPRHNQNRNKDGEVEEASGSGIEPFGMLSNRGSAAMKLFESSVVEGRESVVVSSTSDGEDQTDSTTTTTTTDVRNGTIGISNSAITEPWPKVHIGVVELEGLVQKRRQQKDVSSSTTTSEEQLIQQLKDILALDTFPLEIAKKETSAEGVFGHVRKSVFIPPIKVSKDEYYGTRTNTIILVGNDGHVKYIERTLHEHDDETVEGHEPSESVFEFDIEGFLSAK